MFLIVGLGNPGKKYEHTRHNIGSRIIDQLESLGLANIILAKPKTFMNESGKAVKSMIKDHDMDSQDLIVIHDDIDLPLGSIRISKASGSAGHKGVESIIQSIGTKNFIRIRVGIQPKFGKPAHTEDFVLRKFTGEEEKILKEVTKKTLAALEIFLKEGLEKAMNGYNK